jgi:iron transport multicopper oxidase
MCLSLSYFPVLALLLLIGAVATEAKTVTYDFNITWVRANPDGAFERDTIGVNNEWPLPTIRADVGDNIIVNVENGLGDQSTSLHFHGLYMNGSTHMDGPAQVSQCAIAPGQKFTYNFTVFCISSL